MMSKRCKYALKTLSLLARHDKYVPVPTAKISAEATVPRKFLEQILLELKKNGYVASKQGSVGGYYLLKPADQITVAEIYRLMDGAIALLPCVSEKFYQPCDDCKTPEECSLREFFGQIRERNYEMLSQETIANLVQRGS